MHNDGVSFLDRPSVLINHLQPSDFDFTHRDKTFIERSNAFLRFYLAMVFVLLIVLPTKYTLFVSLFTLIPIVLYSRSQILGQKTRLEGVEEILDRVSAPATTEAFMLLSKTSGQPTASAGGTHQYRKPTRNNPTGNFLPTDYLENAEALPAPPANNREADQERLVLMEQAIVDMSPHNAKLMERINASPTERKMFERSLRPFLTNPVTSASPDMESFFDFIAGPHYRTRKTGKEEFAKQQPRFIPLGTSSA